MTNSHRRPTSRSVIFHAKIMANALALPPLMISACVLLDLKGIFARPLFPVPTLARTGVFASSLKPGIPMEMKNHSSTCKISSNAVLSEVFRFRSALVDLDSKGKLKDIASALLASLDAIVNSFATLTARMVLHVNSLAGETTRLVVASLDSQEICASSNAQRTARTGVFAHPMGPLNPVYARLFMKVSFARVKDLATGLAKMEETV